MAKKTWIWAKSQAGQPELYIEGELSEESWWGDEVTPKLFRQDLNTYGAGGPVTVYIDSPGGDYFAGSSIYSMLKEYPGKVTVKIIGLAASAASVVAMAGDEVIISPTACMMIHSASTAISGNAQTLESEFKKAIQLLTEVNDGVIAAYEAKTGLDREELKNMCASETYMNAQTCLEKGFVDSIADYSNSERVSAVRTVTARATENLINAVKIAENAKNEEELRKTIALESKKVLAKFERKV